MMNDTKEALNRLEQSRNFLSLGLWNASLTKMYEAGRFLRMPVSWSDERRSYQLTDRGKLYNFELQEQVIIHLSKVANHRNDFKDTFSYNTAKVGKDNG